MADDNNSLSDNNVQSDYKFLWDEFISKKYSTCVICGNEFSFIIKRKYPITCSEICKKERARQHQIKYEKLNPYIKVPTEQRNCAICNNLFWLTKRNPRTLTCGKICGAKLSAKDKIKKTRICLKCEKEYIPQNRRTTNRVQLFCSRICAGFNPRAKITKIPKPPKEIIIPKK